MRRVALGILACIAAVRGLEGLETPRVFEIATGSTPRSLAVNSTTGQVFALGAEGLLTSIDELTRRRSWFTVASDSFAIAVDSQTGRAYLPGIEYLATDHVPIDPFAGQLTLLEPATGDTTVVTDQYLGLPTVNSTTHRVYVTRPYFFRHTGVAYHSVTVFDGTTLEKHDVSITGARSQAIGVDELHDRIYVATATDFRSPTPVTIIDGVTERTADIDIGCQSTDVAVDAGRSRAWVRCFGTPDVFLIDGDPLAGGARVIRYSLDGTPAQLAVNSTTGRLYVGLEGRTSLIEIDVDRRLIREIAVGEPVNGLAVNPATNVIFAVHASAVSLVEGDSHERIEIGVGAGASTVVVDAVRDIAWVATAAGVTGLYGPGAPCSHCTRVVDRP